MKKGICYGVSVGPGNPELLTLKALKILQEADVIFLPSAPKEKCRAYQIINDIGLDEEKIICIDTAGMADPKEQSERYGILAYEVSRLLDQGKNVAFPALGEVSLYSTYFYVHARLVEKGYKCKIVSGISSVQETANMLQISLAQGDEQLHIFPDTENLLDRLRTSGTKVFMKPKSNLAETVSTIIEFCEENPGVNAYGVSNCGRESQVIATSYRELNKLNGYMTVIIVK